MLSGIRILDLSQYLPGPLASQLLADLGADVIKIEHPRLGDPIRHMGAVLPGSNLSALFYQVNRNKKSVALSIKNPAGLTVIKKILKSCDILIEGFRPGMLDELGLGYEDLKAEFPSLIYCSISGYGANGPYRNRAGHDGNYMAFSGLLSVNGTPERPVLAGFQLADMGGGTWPAVAGILAALFDRTRTGQGRRLDIGMLDGAFTFWPLQAGEYQAHGQEPGRENMVLSGKLPNYRIYETRDGRFVMFAALEERFLRAFFRKLGQESTLDEMQGELRQGSMEALEAVLRNLFADRTLDQWKPFFEDDECCLAPVLTFSEACADEQIVFRKMWQIPAAGAPGMIGNPILPGVAVCRRLPPELGQDTVAVLSGAGITPAELEDLRKRRVIAFSANS
ncbi:MAG: CoA transferase [Spirochaetales bacterium]|nr:CoA transferase [Spirochaetales bacterium]